MTNYTPEYIRANCDAIAGDLRPCAKQQVYAMLVTVDGREFFGANWMRNGEVTVCPRELLGCKSGEGYEHCKSTCNQAFHAEVSAIQACRAYGCDPARSHVYLTGHTYCCNDCKTAMAAAGVATVTIIN